MKRHKTEIVKTTKPFTETICRQPGCKFRNKRAAQGICYGALPDEVDRHIRRISRAAQQHLAEIKDISRRLKEGKDAYIKTLESAFTCAEMNADFSMDSCIRLRSENAKLKATLARMKKQRMA